LTAAYSLENFSSVIQREFCNTIGTWLTSAFCRMSASRQQRPFHIAHYTKSIALFGATHKAVEIMEDRRLA